MPTPTGSTASTDITLSGDGLIDSLVYGTKWGGSLGSGTTLSYSFLSNSSYYAISYSFDNEYLNSYQLSSNQKTAVTQALDAWAAVANINFSRTFDSSLNAGDLRFGGYADMGSDAVAWAYLPGDNPVAGDVWIGPATSDANPTPGTYDYLTFTHEIGHALGLKHSFESDSSNPNTLPTEYEDVRYTVMSYTDAYSFEPTTPMLLDIAAIQYLYGANMQWQTGNNTYQWAANTPVFETIWDAGGIDTLDASNQTTAVMLNLNPGTFSSIGQSFLKYEALGSSTWINNGLSIAYGARIENAVGSAHADTLIGNQWANVLDGRAGADTMSGGNGNDIYYVDNTGDVVSETNASASIGGTDTVYSYLAAYTLGANVENLRLLANGTASGIGNSLNNLIYAGSGNNILDGGAGTDTVSYAYASSAVTANLSTTAVQATGGSGFDTLKNFANLTGSKYNDKLIGNSAANSLNGGSGADRMIGGNGNDIYYVDNTGDVVSETNATASIGGTDTVYSYLAAYTLGTNVENLRLLATGTANGTGNSLNNLIYAGAGNNVLNGGAGNDTASYAYASSAVSVSLGRSTAQNTGGSGSDTLLSIENLTGSKYNDKLTGDAAANTLNGGAGNDILNGLAGADRMIGGDGNDTYYVDNTSDIVSETNATASIGGTDTVYSYLAAYTLGANVENLRLLANGTASGIGNSLNNLIYAGSGNNILDGGAGTDTVSYAYASSAVTANLSTTAVQATGGSGFDTLKNFANLTGSKYNDKLIGNSAANSLNGGSGADRMIGGNGNDIYYVDNTGDVVSETNATASIGGTDTVYSYLAAYTLGANVENLRLLATGTANGTGNSLNNLIYAGAGNNILDGGTGIDTVAYTYAARAVTANLSTTALQATGGSGNDTLLNIENLIGSKYNDKLIGNSAANSLNGGSGADRMIGGNGNDIYYVDNTGDVVSETNAMASTGGIDTVYSYLAAYTLGANVENLRLLATGTANGTGNSLNNLIYAGTGNNILDGGTGIDTVSYAYASSAVSVSLSSSAAQTTGGSGNDTLLNIENLTGSKYNDELTGDAAANTLNGGAGNDTLIGGTGNDLLIGGLGTDTLYGGSGADRFDFNALIEMGLGALRDVIGDFNSSEGDQIDLSTLDADTSTITNDAFSFIGSDAFSNTNAAGQLRFLDGILYGSTNADANAEFEIQLLGVASLSSADLIA